MATPGIFGDVIAALPSIRAIGPGDLVIFDKNKTESIDRRECMRGVRFESLKPLIDAQPYVRSIRWTDSFPDSQLTHDFSTFRKDFRFGEDLVSWQARHVAVKPCYDPWLTARRSARSIGKVVIARSLRYQNNDFPWRRLVAEHRGKLLFVGLPDEHRAFQISQGCVLEYCPTADLLELAEVINGAELFIGNQSCPFWIAAGLGVPLIQEVWRTGPNSRIPRPNARYWMQRGDTI